MRVAFDLTIAERAVTGTRTYARRLLEALQQQSDAVIAWQGPAPAASARGRRARSLASLIRWLGREVPARLASEDMTIYHSPCSLGPRRSPCPVVMTVHDATDLTMPGLYPLSWRLLHAVWGVPAVRRAAAIIAPSVSAGQEIAFAYRIPSERVWVTHEGVDARFRPMEAPTATLARYGLRRPYVLFVGTAGPRKNLERLLEAFARACRASPALDEQLVVAGPSGRLATPLGALARSLGVANRLVLPGWIEEQDLPAIYAGARCLCYASLAEGFGLPILEAMACGTPVLTSNCSSMPEIAGDAALLADPLSVESIAEGLTRLLTDEPLRRDLVARGLEHARGFTWEGTAMATARVYRAAAAGPPAAGMS